MLQIKAASVTVYRGHRQTPYLLGINSLFIVCIGMIRTNSLVDGRARAKARTSATEHVTLYCRWWPSALTTGLMGRFLFFTHSFI